MRNARGSRQRSSTEEPQADLETRLRPGGTSKLGFLGPGESLATVLAQDAATMARLGLTFAALADGLDEIFATVRSMEYKLMPDELRARSAGFPNLYQPATIPTFGLDNLPDPGLGFTVGDIQVFTLRYRGLQKCPWGCQDAGGFDFMLLNRKTGESVTGPSLMPHLMRAHQFCEGHGTPFRTDPEQLARVLGLAGAG